MLRAPQLLACPGLKEVSRPFCKDVLLAACPRHLKWSGIEARTISIGRPGCLRKGVDCQELPQTLLGHKLKQMHVSEMQSSQSSIITCRTAAPDEITTCPDTLTQPMDSLCQPSFSKCLFKPSQNHCQSSRLRDFSLVETPHSSDLKCLKQHSLGNAAKHNPGTTSSFLGSLQYSPSPLSFLSGSHKTLLHPSFTSMRHLRALSSIAVRPPLIVQLYRGAHSAAQLKVAPEYCLSPENEARCRKRLASNTALYQKDKGKSWAAVLVSLCTVAGEPAFLFTLRSSTLKGRHKGDVSFAGGKKDPSDLDVVTTALREAQEELGVSVSPSQVWGVLKPLRDMSGMLIAPVLANLGPLEALSFRPNPGEVEEIFTISLSHVCSPENQGYTDFRVGNRYGYTLPVFRNGKHRVWGLTAVALDHTLKLIVPS